MRNIEVRHNKYGWSAYVNGQHYYTFEGTIFVEDVVRQGGLKNIVDLYITGMQNDKQYWAKSDKLTPNEITQLKIQFIDKLKRYFRLKDDELS